MLTVYLSWKYINTENRGWDFLRYDLLFTSVAVSISSISDHHCFVIKVPLSNAFIFNCRVCPYN